MNGLLKAVLVAVFLTVTGISASSAAEPVWYDASHRAIAIDPYLDRFGGKIEIDFNEDHSWAGLIDQSGWYYLLGDVTAMGLYRYTSTSYPGGGSSQSWVYGWGTSLGSLATASNFETNVRTLYYGAEAADKFRYFTDQWDVANGRTVIYVQPDNNGAVPVTTAALSNVFFRVNWGPWKRFTDIYPPEPEPITATLIVNPQTINLKSKGNWITAYIELPSGFSIYEVDTASIVLTVAQTKPADGKPAEQMLYTAGRMEIGDDNTNSVPDLMVKFDRQDLNRLLAAGDATLTVTGKLKDKTAFVGSDVVKVIH